MSFFIGTAAWNLPKEHQPKFEAAGSHLERYATRLTGVEINSTFYREHQPKTFVRWGETTPKDFRFAVKLSRVFTHDQRLDVDKREVDKTLAGYAGLGKKWGALLIQLPPSLDFESKTAKKFFTLVRKGYDGPIALEPRHLTWISTGAKKLLRDLEISKVRADPEPVPVEEPDAWEPGKFAYFRLHGSPVIYRTDYARERIERYADELRTRSRESWCIFDNTTFGHATANALTMRELLALPRRQHSARDAGHRHADQR